MNGKGTYFKSGIQVPYNKFYITKSDGTVVAVNLEDMSIDEITFADSKYMKFGTGEDVTMNFDGTNFELEGIASATPWLIGASGKVINTTQHGTITVGVDDTGYDVKMFGATSGKYFLWDESADQAYIVGSLKHHNHLTTESYGHQLRTEYNSATGDFFGIDAESHQAISRTAGGMRGFSMCARNVADQTMSSTANMCAGYFLFDNDGTINGSGIQSALVAKVDAGGTFSGVSHLASIWADSTQEGTVTGEHELIYCSNNGASVMDRVIYVYGGNKISNLFEFNTCGTLVATGGTTLGGADPKKIAITIDGVQYYIPAVKEIS